MRCLRRAEFRIGEIAGAEFYPDGHFGAAGGFPAHGDDGAFGRGSRDIVRRDGGGEFPDVRTEWRACAGEQLQREIGSAVLRHCRREGNEQAGGDYFFLTFALMSIN